MNHGEQPDRDPYEPEISDRGLAYMPNIPGTGPHTSVSVHDSSNATHDALWIETRGYHNRDGDGGAAQITINDALTLAAQICALAERRGYSNPLTRAARAQRGVKLGDPVHITNPDGSSYTATIRTISENGKFTAVGNAPKSATTEVTTLHVLEPGLLEFDPEEMPAPGDIINCHLGENTYTVRFHAVREDGSAVIESIDESDISGLVTGHTDPLHARHYTPRGYPYDTMATTPGASNANIPDGPLPLAVVLDADLTRIDETIVALAERVDRLEREREPMSANDIVKTKSDLARQLHEARRDAAAWEQAAGTANSRVADIKAEKRGLEGELAGMHERERAVDMVLDSVVDGNLTLTYPVDAETPAGRVYELVSTLLRQAQDAEARLNAHHRHDGALEHDPLPPEPFHPRRDLGGDAHGLKDDGLEDESGEATDGED